MLPTDSEVCTLPEDCKSMKSVNQKFMEIEMKNIEIAREKILNDMQREVRNIIFEDDIKNVQERNEVIAYFKEAMKLNEQWDIFDAGEYEQHFYMDELRINPVYKSQAIVKANNKRKYAKWSK
mgnify:CR=1 FL=1